MHRLNTISSHVTSQDKFQESLLDQYKKMSEVDVDTVVRFIYPYDWEDYCAYAPQFRQILSDKSFFQRETYEEMSRQEEVISINRKFKRILTEARKILPMRELFQDVNKFVTMAGEACQYNDNISTKMTVSLQLYYKTVDNLGTDQHNEWKVRAEEGTDIGCFGLTELGHGSNVRGIQTRATYDKIHKEFVLHTPSEQAMKFWIGGAGKTSNTAAIFAQLFIDGKCYGPHAFVVQIRDRETHFPLNGVILGDCGKKEGLNGVDNGFIIFNNHRIPRKNLLNRFSDVLEDGTFVSEIQSNDQRFGLQIGTLTTGRILTSTSMLSNLCGALKVAIRFASIRQQFGKPNSDQETSLIEYQLHQHRLFPYVANAFALYQGFRLVIKLWGKNQKRLFIPNSPKLAEVHALISCLKSMSTWTSFQGVHQCRLACGGLGYSYYSKLPTYLKTSDVPQTWEGDNNVLLQQTGKYLLDLFKQKVKGKNKKTVTCEWIKIQPVEGEKCEVTTEDDFVSYSNLVQAFEFKTNLLLQRTGIALSSKLGDNDPIEAWNETQVFHIQDLAKSFADLICVKEFATNLQQELPNLNPDTAECFSLLFKLNALHKIQNDLGPFFETGYFDSEHGAFVRNQILKCCNGLKRHMVKLTYGLTVDESYMDSMLAPEDGYLYKSVINRLFSAPDAFKRTPIWKEIYNK